MVALIPSSNALI